MFITLQTLKQVLFQLLSRFDINIHWSWLRISVLIQKLSTFCLFLHISDLGLLGDQKHIYSLPLITLPDRTDDSDYNLEPDEG